MASLSIGADGLSKVYFKGAGGKRQCLYLGRTTKKKAEVIERCISDLERCRVDASVPHQSTIMWLVDISDELHTKLAKHGLTTARRVAEAPVAVTIDDLIARYKARPRWSTLADGTRTCHHYSFIQIRQYFGPGRDITTITETDAEDMVATLGENYAEATVAGITGCASMLLRFGVRSRLLVVNPFEGIRRGSYVTPHKAYVDAATCQKIIDDCTDLETKLVVAFARFAGLRTPSEPRVLLWRDVDWSGRRFLCNSPKTGPRAIPIVAELMKLLEQQFEAVPEGTDFVLPSVAAAERTTYPHRVNRVVARLKLDRWPRLMHSMRASRQTDWNEVFPAHVTAAWMGNSPTIGDKYYNRTLDAHFDAATNPLQNPLQTVTDKPRHDETASRAGD